MKNIKLILCDIDNTLVVTHQLMSENNKKAIQYIKDKGIYFGVASGRNIKDLKYIVSTWNIGEVDCIVGLNGSELWDGIHNKEYKYFQLEPEWIKETFEIMHPFEFNPVMYFDKAYMVGRYDQKVHYSVQFTKADFTIAKEESDFYQGPNPKIMFRLEHKEDMPKVEQRVKEFESPYYSGYKTQPDLMEFQNRKASKAYAMEQFCILNGFTKENVMAFGDTSNDNEMLKSAGIGVCMLNGSNDTKACADIITDLTCADDGFYDFIMKNI